jgi:hypothetical protein
VITYRVEIDGVAVGPDFSTDGDRFGEEEEVVHRWVALHHPGSGYTILTARPGQADRRMNYPASDRP